MCVCVCVRVCVLGWPKGPSVLYVKIEDFFFFIFAKNFIEQGILFHYLCHFSDNFKIPFSQSFFFFNLFEQRTVPGTFYSFPANENFVQ